jgi:hypothetical protein
MWKNFIVIAGFSASLLSSNLYSETTGSGSLKSVIQKPEEPVAEPVEMAHYTNKDKKYSFDYPSTWEKKDSLKELDIMVLAPIETPQDDFRQNVSIISGKLQEPVTLDEFYAGNLENLKNSLADFKLEDEGNAKINGILSKWVNYTHTLEKLDLKVMQYFLVIGNYVYVLTCTAEAGKFDRYQEPFSNVVKSFRSN